MTIRVSVFDHHPVVHQGLTRLLPLSGFAVVSQAFDGRDAVSRIRDARPDIVLTDIRMPKYDGLKLLETLRDSEPDLRAIVYTEHRNPTYVARSIARGAVDYVLKDQPFEVLLQSMKNALASIAPDENGLFQSIRRQMTRRKVDSENPHSLTNREYQVLHHLGFGLSNREIAGSLGISVETVKEHVQNILRKQDSNDRTQAAVWAVRDSLARQRSAGNRKKPKDP